jgi:ferredoxin-NADP reductase/Na+-translocating ferredoxin:NAD+ oxidoreductase RnfD subunit
MKYIDYFLDRITMYRLLLYYLLVLLGAAMVLAALGYLPYSPLVIAGDAAYLTLFCWLANKVFARIFEVPANPESPLITALILALIISPHASGQYFIFLNAAAGLAIASKYILAIRGQHIFNPAAVAVALTALGGGQAASWWVGNAPLMPVVVVGGILLARKIRRGQMITIFLTLAFVTTTILALIHGGNAISTSRNLALHSSVWFLAFVMLTEPLTSPTMAKQQRWYGVLAGLLFSPQVHLLSIYSTPELVLVVSNAFSYIVSPKVKLLPKLSQKVTWGPSVRDFVFTTNQKFNYKPGQYMEWTLPHENPDNRGSRRYFTLASSPTEDNLRLGVKFYSKSSSFKHAMWSMEPNTPIAAGQLGGDFILPDDTTRKLAFIAGGIGITPFRSMLKYLIDTEDKRTVTLIYSERDPDDFAYHDVLKSSWKQLKTKVIYTVTGHATDLPSGVRKGKITTTMIAEEVPDYMDRLFYISGSHSMVSSIKASLRSLGVADHNIKIDFFPGYA